MLSGKTSLIGILGWPVEHSFSPAIHNAAFSALNLNYAYVPLPTKAEHLHQAIHGLIAMGFRGANVTIPHKVAVLKYLDEIDPIAKTIGAVNTIKIEDGKTIGYNTDAEGFVKSLQNKDIEIQDSNVIILGAGGAARAIVCGLLNYGTSQVSVVARSAEKAANFANSIKSHRVSGLAWDDKQFNYLLSGANIVINSTPIGMSPIIDNEPAINWKIVNRKAVICDLIYNPLRTKFLTRATQLGHITVSGDGMLVEQGALAFELWTGNSAPRHIMYDTLSKALS